MRAIRSGVRPQIVLASRSTDKRYLGERGIVKTHYGA
jgi:hypothetical protein